jgi:hypothetical protein
VIRVNQIVKIVAIESVFFADQQIRVTKMQDFPLISVTEFARAVASNQEDIKALTFFHLGRKFDRSTQPQAMSQFLGPSLYDTLYFCPQCLNEPIPCHSLLWRFKYLLGCHRHCCYLLNQCLGCKRTIPLVMLGQKIGFCPHCSVSLSNAPTEKMTENECVENLQIVRDLSYLLAPQEWETDATKLAQFFGHFVADKRRRLNLMQETIANALDTPLKQICG